MSKFDRLSVYAVLLASGLTLFACRGRQTKDKYTDTATSGFISISADESFRRIVQQEIDVFESIYTMAGIDPIYASEVDAINLLLKDSVRLTVSTRRLTDAEKAGLEEAEHAAKFAELLGEVVTDSTQKNLQMRVDAENGATAGKFELAKLAKQYNLDAIHDTVHEMARDEARHGKAFEGLLKRYFG